jgi:hypothetical protein
MIGHTAMPCPFPGMDPYIERPEIWPDFHDSLVTYIREALQPLLRPRYAAICQDRLYVVEHRRPIHPDVSVVRTMVDEGGVAVAALPDTPLVVEIVEEEISQPLIHIIEPAAGNRIVTGIEVLSPDNKTPGPGRESFLRKREELRRAGAHFVEIDLLRDGERSLPIPADGLQGALADVSRWHYLVTVARRPRYYEYYPATVRQRLPRVGIPLAHDDPDVTLDLQAVFSRCWEAGAYPELLHYDGPPPGTFSEEDAAWCRRQAASVGGKE